MSSHCGRLWCPLRFVFRFLESTRNASPSRDLLPLCVRSMHHCLSRPREFWSLVISVAMTMILRHRVFRLQLHTLHTGWEQCLFLNAVPHTYNLYGCRLLNSPAVSAKFWLSFESQPQNLAIKIDLNRSEPRRPSNFGETSAGGIWKLQLLVARWRTGIASRCVAGRSEHTRKAFITNNFNKHIS